MSENIEQVSEKEFHQEDIDAVKSLQSKYAVVLAYFDCNDFTA